MPGLEHAPEYFSNQGSVGRAWESTSSEVVLAEHCGPSCKNTQQTNGVGLVGGFSGLGSLCFCRAFTRLLVTSTIAHTDKLLNVLALLLICGDCVLARCFRFGNSGVVVASQLSPPSPFASDSQSQYPIAQGIGRF